MPKTNSFSFCNCILKQRKFVFSSGDVAASFSKAFSKPFEFAFIFIYILNVQEYETFALS